MERGVDGLLLLVQKPGEQYKSSEEEIDFKKTNSPNNKAPVGGFIKINRLNLLFKVFFVTLQFVVKGFSVDVQYLRGFFLIEFYFLQNVHYCFVLCLAGCTF